MVKGLDTFQKYFADYEEQYVLIGGAACDILFESNEVMLMCHKVTRKNLIDSNPLFRYYLTHTLCNFFVKPIDSDTSEEI